MGTKTLLATAGAGFALGWILTSLEFSKEPKRQSSASEPVSVFAALGPAPALSKFSIRPDSRRAAAPAFPDASTVDWLRRLPNAREVWAIETRDSSGRAQRQSLLETSYKYPWVRVEGPAAMVADHLVVTLRSGRTDQDLRAFGKENDLEIRGSIAGTRIYLISFAVEPPERFHNVKKLLEAHPELVERVEPDYLAVRDAEGP